MKQRKDGTQYLHKPNVGHPTLNPTFTPTSKTRELNLTWLRGLLVFVWGADINGFFRKEQNIATDT